jgi:hypothetical protein
MYRIPSPLTGHAVAQTAEGSRLERQDHHHHRRHRDQLARTTQNFADNQRAAENRNTDPYQSERVGELENPFARSVVHPGPLKIHHPLSHPVRLEGQVPLHIQASNRDEVPHLISPNQWVQGSPLPKEV